MSRHLAENTPKSKELFRLRFEQLLRDYALARRSTAEGFGLAWEKTLEDVPLAEEEQPTIYWELIRWARGRELFTEPAPADPLEIALREVNDTKRLVESVLNSTESLTFGAGLAKATAGELQLKIKVMGRMKSHLTASGPPPERVSDIPRQPAA
jgi:hypothetical protein